MLPALLLKAGEDEQLSRLLEEAREYAGLYLMARKRQKGCDGMGELAMVREEFAGSLERLAAYGGARGYLAGDSGYDLDVASEELAESAD